MFGKFCDDIDCRGGHIHIVGPALSIVVEVPWLYLALKNQS
jgi:hypothetical protein